MTEEDARTARLRSAACAAPGNDRASSSVIPQAYDAITPFAYRSDKCSVLEVHGCEFRLIGSWWAEAARQEAGAPGSGGHGPARAERALPVRQRTQSEALLWGAAGAVRGGAGQGVLVPAGPLGRVGAGCAIRRRGGRAAG